MASPDAGSKTQGTIMTLVMIPLDWLEERSGLVGGVKYFLFRKVPRDIELVAHARLGDADRVPRPGRSPA